MPAWTASTSSRGGDRVFVSRSMDDGIGCSTPVQLGLAGPDGSLHRKTYLEAAGESALLLLHNTRGGDAHTVGPEILTAFSNDSGGTWTEPRSMRPSILDSGENEILDLQDKG